MRASINPKDPGYLLMLRTWRGEIKIRVFVDGRELKNVVEADEEQGYAVAHVLNAEGKPQVDPTDRSKVWVHRHAGVVRIEIEDLKS